MRTFDIKHSAKSVLLSLKADFVEVYFAHNVTVLVGCQRGAAHNYKLWVLPLSAGEYMETRPLLEGEQDKD